MKSSHVLAICVVTALLLGSSSFTEAQEVRFDYTDGPFGPANWGNIPEWALCGTGREQSPIDVTREISVIDNTLDKKLQTNYPTGPVPASISNDGHTIEVALGGLFLTIDNVTYESDNFHFHYPSEHTLDGTQYELELHLVHIEPVTSAIAVVGWFFNVGAPSPFLAQFFDVLPDYRPGEEVEEFPIEPIVFSLPTDVKYGRYNGSLTTPPCSEGVTWTLILGAFPTLSSDQLTALSEKFESNARPVQDPNGRKVLISKCH